jgi:S1-C subfamily serine protease
MSGNALDVGLVVVGVLFALSGYRQGFLVGVLSFGGFLGGGVLGAHVAPDLATLRPLASFPRPVVGLAVVFVAAVLGQVLATALAAALRRRLTWHPARQLDAAGGAAVSLLSLLLIAWLVGRAVASSPYPSLASSVRNSVVITTVDGLVPDAGRDALAGFRDLVGERGFPEVFEDLQPVDAGDVAPPDTALAASAVVRQVAPSVLKVTGVAEDCRKRIEGSGFVYAAERVLTNAHVVAGVREPQVEVDGEQLPARVVLFDPGRDVAVLAVDGLRRPALTAAPAPAAAGDSAIVVGYPRDGPFRSDPARVIRTQDARGQDIYQERSVVREIYAVKGLVRSGNSGGPLVDVRGRVLGVVFAAAADDASIGYVLTWDEVDGPALTAVTSTQEVSTRTCG